MITQIQTYNSNGVTPSAVMDPSLRRLIYGRIRPMGRPGLLARLLHPGDYAPEQPMPGDLDSEDG